MLLYLTTADCTQALCIVFWRDVKMFTSRRDITPAKMLLSMRFLTLEHFEHNFYKYMVAQKERNGRYSRFSGLCYNQQLLSSLCWIEHLFPIIITSRSSNLVENFLFYETFLMDCHFRDLPDFQSFEARWQINGKSQKWQSIRNYS